MTTHAPFIMLPHAVYDTPTFAQLKPIHVAILLLLIRKHNGYNNGAIALGVREAANRCHCSQMTACRAFTRLQNDGLITATYKGHLVPEIGRPDIATRWKLNFLKESARVSGKPKGQGRFSNDPSGCFPGDTSPSPPVRFPSDTSPRASLVIQSKDNLTTAKQRGSRDRECVWLPASPGDGPARDGPERAALNPHPGKPKGRASGMP
jgi:DNA-binding transcriptional regulator YhcF (GntR family)